MADKLVIDCLTDEATEKDYTPEELQQIDINRQQSEEQELIDSLTPTEKEMLMAEVEIQTITILMEVGLI